MFLVYDWRAVVILTCRSRRLCCNRRADSLSPQPCRGQSSGAGPQRRGGPHTGWAPGFKHRKKLNACIKLFSTAQILQCTQRGKILQKFETHLNSLDSWLKVFSSTWETEEQAVWTSRCQLKNKLAGLWRNRLKGKNKSSRVFEVHFRSKVNWKFLSCLSLFSFLQ